MLSKPWVLCSQVPRAQIWSQGSDSLAVPSATTAAQSVHPAVSNVCREVLSEHAIVRRSPTPSASSTIFIETKMFAGISAVHPIGATADATDTWMCDDFRKVFVRGDTQKPTNCQNLRLNLGSSCRHQLRHEKGVSIHIVAFSWRSFVPPLRTLRVHLRLNKIKEHLPRRLNISNQQIVNPVFPPVHVGAA